MTGRDKLDDGKPPAAKGALHSFPRALLAVAELSDRGAAKYSWHGWRGVPNGVERYGDALARHLIQEGYELTDAETGFLHAVHVAWNALVRLELMLTPAQPSLPGCEPAYGLPDIMLTEAQPCERAGRPGRRADE